MSIYKELYTNKMLSGKAIKALKLDYPDVHFDQTEMEDKKFRVNANVDKNTSSEVIEALKGKGVYFVHHEEAPKPVSTEPSEEEKAVAAAKATAKAAKAAAPKKRWKDTWPDQCRKVQEKVAKGEEPFKAGSKRAICRDLVLKKDETGETVGCTMKEAMDALGWDKNTCNSAFTEIAQLYGMRIQPVKKGEEDTRYRAIPDSPEAVEARRIDAAKRKEEKEAAKAAANEKKKADKEAAAKEAPPAAA